MPEWSDFRVLLAVGRAGSLKAAARLLAVDKATVGRRLAALERDAGVRLVRRRADGVTITDAGQAALDAALAMDRAAEGFAARLAGRRGPRATVRVTAPVWFVTGALTPALPALLRANEDLQVVFASGSRIVNLAQREADVAVRNVVPDQASMTVRRVTELGSALYASRGYLRARGVPRAREELREHAFVGYEDRVTYVQGLRWLEAEATNVPVRGNDAVTLAAAVEAGAGLAVLPCFVGDAMSSLVRVELGGLHRDKIWVVVPTEMKTAPGVREVMDFVVGVFRDNAARLSG